MITCDKCRGGGLIGAGDQPWLKNGAVSTCDKCTGTGQVDESANTVSETPVEAPVEAPVVDESANAPGIQVGDACTTVEGMAGTMQPNEDGTFTCVENAIA